jgi:DeoR/GlpR family transcriptional regulator of sugar metabolism
MSTKKPAKMDAHTRLSHICELLKSSEHVSIPELAKTFGVSEMTARRDLEKLENDGQVRRTRGGAMPTEKMEFEFDFTQRRQTRQKEKQAIAKKALDFISPSQRIILDTGTTTLELAYLLRDFKDLTIITPSLAVASVLQFSPGIQTVLLGGIIRKGSPDLTGLVTESNLDMFAVDIAFQGADGIGADGTLYSNDMRIVKVDQKIRKRAAKSYILADSYKLGRTALATNGQVSEIDALITDKAIPEDLKKNFEDTGAKIITV